MEDASLKLVIFSFIISLLFPIFAYTFTSFGTTPTVYDVSLSQDVLTSAGIVLADGESHNITFDTAWTEYTVKNNTMRIRWESNILKGDFMGHYRQSYIENVLGTWLFPERMTPQIEGLGVLVPHGMDNATIVNNFNTDYNWTKYSIIENGLTVFVTTLPSDNNNITKAVYETGTVTVTVGSLVLESGSVSALHFVDWYVSVVTGQAENWGFPSFMVWIVRIMSFMTLLSAYLLGVELIP